MKKLSLTLIIFTVLSALVFSGCARTPEQRAARFVEHIADELKLDDAQKVKLDRIKEEFLVKRLEMITERNETYDETIALMKSDRIDQAKFNALIEKSQARTGEAVKFFFTKFAEFHDMLTPEQRTKVVEHLNELREKHKR
jgi:Spy/CpxP family protein refolding chaperone